MREFWRGKVVLLTGHTGFKGSWLSEILLNLGANVIGCALEAKRESDLFNLCGLQNRLDHHIVDIRCKNKLMAIFQQTMPDIVFHLAAQPLVLPSYEDPLTTWDTNLMGSLNLLECLRDVGKKCSVVMVTTDKVYEISDEKSAKIENDHLGGHDPYSSSKAAMEIAVSSWRRSFFKHVDIRIATALAGNVIGGGDWSEDRLIPDLIRSIISNKKLIIRYPLATRPWQHVMELNNGYISLIEKLYKNPKKFSGPWNFGPNKTRNKSVQEIVDFIKRKYFLHLKYQVIPSKDYIESIYLSLDTSKTFKYLKWQNNMTMNHLLKLTISWYFDFLYNDMSSFNLINSQIKFAKKVIK